MLFISTLLLITIVLSSCSVKPLSLYKLKLNESYKKSNQINSAWFKGSELVSLQEDSLIVILSYQKTDLNGHFLNLNIINSSPNTELIDPKNSYYVSFDKRGYTDTIFAIDPEREIIKNQKAQLLNNADYLGKEQTAALFTLLGLAIDVAKIGSKKSEAEEQKEREEKLNKKIDHLEDQVNYQQNYIKINNHEEFWTNSVLRKTSIPKNFSYSGLLIFPNNIKAKELLFHIKIGKKIFKIMYDTEEIKVNN